MLFDISVRVDEETPEWPGDSPFRCNWTALIAGGSAVNLSTLSGSPHVGTHADSPLHVDDGWPGSEHIPVAPFVGRATVIDVSDVEGGISAGIIAERAGPGELVRVLLRSNCTVASGTFPVSWPSLAPEALEYLLGERGLQLLGTDSPSVDDRHSKSLQNHRAIFGAGAFVLENLDLRATEPGVWELLALPLNVAGLDAAPVRAFLRTLS